MYVVLSNEASTTVHYLVAYDNVTSLLKNIKVGEWYSFKNIKQDSTRTNNSKPTTGYVLDENSQVLPYTPANNPVFNQHSLFTPLDSLSTIPAGKHFNLEVVVMSISDERSTNTTYKQVNDNLPISYKSFICSLNNCL